MYLLRMSTKVILGKNTCNVILIPEVKLNIYYQFLAEFTFKIFVATEKKAMR
jgi:hypothetical protein